LVFRARSLDLKSITCARNAWFEDMVLEWVFVHVLFWSECPRFVFIVYNWSQVRAAAYACKFRSHILVRFWRDLLACIEGIFICLVFFWLILRKMFVKLWIYINGTICSSILLEKPVVCIVCLWISIVPAGTLRLPWRRFFRAFSSVERQMPG
jgi:hypothetical protein